MTGFGNESLENSKQIISIEIRSVNYKYFDCSIKLPEIIKEIESDVRKMLTKNIIRGKVEIKINVLENEIENENPISINAVKELRKIETNIKKYFPNAKELSVYEILNHPKTFEVQKDNTEEIYEQVLLLTKKCLDNYIDSCKREGSRLESHILLCVKKIEEYIKEALKLAPKAERLINERIKARLLDVTSESFKDYYNSQSQKKIDSNKMHSFLEFFEDRLRIEAGLASSKINISEELERMSSHTHEIRRVFAENKDQAIGKRIEFLSQEMHREANTIGSKSSTIGLSKISIEIRLLIDQIKEQVQNLQ